MTPDISLPAISDVENYGESSFDNALPWTQIKAADYRPVGDLKGILPMLIASHDARVAKDQDYQYLLQDITDMNIERKRNLISLNLADRRKERDAQEARVKSREKSSGTEKDSKVKANNEAASVETLQDDGLQANERNLDADLAMAKARKNSKDVLLNETVHILSDEVGLLNDNANLSVRVMPK